MDLIRDFAAKVEKLYVVEELDGFMDYEAYGTYMMDADGVRITDYGLLRREGDPIASSGNGYFYAENAAEVYATIRSLKKMRRGLDAAIEGLEMALARFGEGS